MQSIAILTAISLAGILIVLSRLRACAVDHFRANVFALRNEMFDFAESGGIPFGHPAYGMLRTIMNGFIRGAHTIRVLSPLTYLVIWRSRAMDQRAEDLEASWTATLETLPESASEQIRKYRLELHRLLVFYLLYGSPVFLVTVVATVIPALLLLVVIALGKVTVVDPVVNRFSGVLSEADEQARAAGEDPSLVPAF